MSYNSQNVTYNCGNGAQISGKVQNNGKTKVYGDLSSSYGGFGKDLSNAPNQKKRKIMRENDKYADEGVVDHYAGNKENQRGGNGQQRFNQMGDDHNNHSNHNSRKHRSNGGGHGHTYNGKNNGGYNGNQYRVDPGRGRFRNRGRGYRHIRHRNYGRRYRGNYPSQGSHQGYEQGSVAGGYVDQYNKKPSWNDKLNVNNDNNNTNDGLQLIWNNNNNAQKLFKTKALEEVFSEYKFNKMRHSKIVNKCLLSLFTDGNEETEAFHEILEQLADKHKETYFACMEYGFVRELKEEMSSIKFQSLPVVIAFINGKPVAGWDKNYNWAKTSNSKFDISKIEQILHLRRIVDNLCITPNIQHISFDQ